MFDTSMQVSWCSLAAVVRGLPRALTERRHIVDGSSLCEAVFPFSGKMRSILTVELIKRIEHNRQSGL